MASEPPPFQEAARCDVCKCSFNTFRRRHHCRCCGRTLCHEHSSNQMTLPQFGIHTNVRVCADCFNNSTRSEKVDSRVSSYGVNSVTDKVSRLDIGAEVDTSSGETETKPTLTLQNQSATAVVECKCGMPLCICEAPAPATDATILKTTSTSTSQSNPKPRRTEATPKNRASTSTSKASSVFNRGQVTNGTADRPQVDYEANGEGVREAIKNGDTVAVKKLLSEGVDANYCDKQGMSLLHLAALFNKTDIAFILMDFGANLSYKNAQGETPLDCAPVTLQHKMKQKMEESGQQGPHISV